MTEDKPRQGPGSIGWSDTRKDFPIGEVFSSHVGFDIRRYEDDHRITLWFASPKSWGAKHDPRVSIWKAGIGGLPDVRWSGGGQSGGQYSQAVRMIQLLEVAIEEMEALQLTGVRR